MNYIEELQDVIKRLHDSESTHVETVPVKEVFEGETVWEGEVEVFDLHDHPRTSRVYAWTHQTEDADHPKRHVTVLQIPPATTPENAVRTSIMSDYKEQNERTGEA
jgi:hypothetical protein